MKQPNIIMKKRSTISFFFIVSRKVNKSTMFYFKLDRINSNVHTCPQIIGKIIIKLCLTCRKTSVFYRKLIVTLSNLLSKSVTLRTGKSYSPIRKAIHTHPCTRSGRWPSSAVWSSPRLQSFSWKLLEHDGNSIRLREMLERDLDTPTVQFRRKSVAIYGPTNHMHQVPSDNFSNNFERSRTRPPESDLGEFCFGRDFRR